MNAKLQKELQSKLRNVDFGEHVIGYRHGQYRNQRQEDMFSSLQPQQKRSYRKTEKAKGKEGERATRGSERRYHTNRWEKGNWISRDENQDESYRDHFYEEEQALEDPSNDRHAEFVRSYQGWLKDTYVNGYQTARLPTSFGTKRSRASLKSSRREQGADMQCYQMQINQEYKQGNLFPCRPYQSLKKMRIGRKNDFESSPLAGRPKYKGEGQLKIKLMKSMAKKQLRGQQKKKVKINYQSTKNIPRPQSALLKNFSNPKILSIQNRQLVTGTKIILI